jgi:hypothetical protein
MTCLDAATSHPYAATPKPTSRHTSHMMNSVQPLVHVGPARHGIGEARCRSREACSPLRHFQPRLFILHFLSSQAHVLKITLTQTRSPRSYQAVTKRCRVAALSRPTAMFLALGRTRRFPAYVYQTSNRAAMHLQTIVLEDDVFDIQLTSGTADDPSHLVASKDSCPCN